ncbi:MAG: GNAT family N-acetyltransferase [Armatimonadota bacterium]
MIIRSIRPDEIDRCLDLWDKSFVNTSRSYFKRYFYGDPWFTPEYTRVCEDDGRIVSAVQIVRREVRCGSSTLVMGGIGNVGTLPESHGKGYSSATMRDAIKVMLNGGMDFSMLFTGINPFYERLGYCTIDFPVGAARLKPRLTPSETSYTVRPYENKDAEAVVSIYNEFNSDIALSTVRTPGYWRGFAIDPDAEPFDIWVAERDGEIAGYAAGHVYSKSYQISEVCYSKGHEGSIKALIHKVWELAADAHAEELICRLSYYSTINTAIAEIASPLKPKTCNYMMVKVLNLRDMFERLLPELSLQAANVQSEALVNIAVDGIGDVNLGISPGHVTVSDQQSEMKIGLTQYQLFNLVFGYRNPAEILPMRPGAELLATIFPKRTPVFYLIDSF